MNWASVRPTPRWFSCIGDRPVIIPYDNGFIEATGVGVGGGQRVQWLGFLARSQLGKLFPDLDRLRRVSQGCVGDGGHQPRHFVAHNHGPRLDFQAATENSDRFAIPMDLSQRSTQFQECDSQARIQLDCRAELTDRLIEPTDGTVRQSQIIAKLWELGIGLHSAFIKTDRLIDFASFRQDLRKIAAC